MINNDILRRLRYSLRMSDSKIVAILQLVDEKVPLEKVSSWLKKDDDPAYVACNDRSFSNLLNGLIIDKRGKKDGPLPQPEKKLTNNMIFKKLKIALNLKDDDILEILLRADIKVSKHELSAFFRNSSHKHYRECKDQFLRNFLRGLQIKYRP